MQNPFQNPAFSMTSLTAAINILPNTYGRLEQLNLMPPNPVRFRSITIEELNGGVKPASYSNTRFTGHLGQARQTDGALVHRAAYPA